MDTAIKLQKEQTIFLTTHYLEEANEADLIYVLENGHVLAQGSADELRRKYAQTELKLVFTKDPQLDGGHRVASKSYLFSDVDSLAAIKLIEHYKGRLQEIT